MAILLTMLALACGALVYNGMSDRRTDTGDSPSSTGSSSSNSNSNSYSNSNSNSNSTPESAPHSSGAQLQNVLTCKKEQAFCTLQYEPSECSVTVQGKEHKAGASNACQAQAALQKTLCEKGITELSAQEWEKMSCKRIEE